MAAVPTATRKMPTLYTPEVLALAVELARYPMTDEAALVGSARSQSCGSVLDVSLRCDGQSRIEELGLKVTACAIGQASAAIFARHARGRNLEDISTARHAMASWLGGDGAQPDWPDLELLTPARAYPARHGAILLPWKAAEQALSKA